MKNSSFLMILGMLGTIFIIALPVVAVILAGILFPAIVIFGLPILLIAGIASKIRS